MIINPATSLSLTSVDVTDGIFWQITLTANREAKEKRRRLTDGAHFFFFYSNFSELCTSSNDKKYHEWYRRVKVINFHFAARATHFQPPKMQHLTKKRHIAKIAYFLSIKLILLGMTLFWLTNARSSLSGEVTLWQRAVSKWCWCGEVTHNQNGSAFENFRNFSDLWLID